MGDEEVVPGGLSWVGENVLVRFEFSSRVELRLMAPLNPESGDRVIVVAFEAPPGIKVMIGILGDRKKSGPGTLTRTCVALINVPLEATRLTV